MPALHASIPRPGRTPHGRAPLGRRVAAVLAVLTATGVGAAEPGPRGSPAPPITVVSSTSTENSGLLERLLPAFSADTGIPVRLIAVGTGQALRIGRDGDADALLVHHPDSERAFVADGFGIDRVAVMHNDFVLVGPAGDPAGIAGMEDAAAALARIAAAAAPFASRGDESGTHRKERELWAAAGIDPAAERGAWYRETGSGQGANLNVASAMSAYALTDRASWLRFGNKGDLRILLEGDPRLHNPYHALRVNPARHPHVRAAGAEAFLRWLTSARGQDLIAAYRIDGHVAFLPAAPGCAGGGCVRTGAAAP